MRAAKAAIAVVVLGAALSGCAGGAQTAGSASTTSASVSVTNSAAAVPSVVGQRLDTAYQSVVSAGYVVVAQDSTGQGRTIIVKSNWTVTSETVSGKTITLGAQKIADSSASAAANAAAVDSQRADQIRQYLLTSYGVTRFSDILATDPSSWAAIIQDISVETGNLHVTIQAFDKATGQQAAKALSALIPKSLTNGLSWVIVSDGTGRVIAQEMLKPIS